VVATDTGGVRACSGRNHSTPAPQHRFVVQAMGWRGKPRAAAGMRIVKVREPFYTRTPARLPVTSRRARSRERAVSGEPSPHRATPMPGGRTSTGPWLGRSPRSPAVGAGEVSGRAVRVSGRSPQPRRVTRGRGHGRGSRAHGLPGTHRHVHERGLRRRRSSSLPTAPRKRAPPADLSLTLGSRGRRGGRARDPPGAVSR
jgi:hypothetical protein